MRMITSTLMCFATSYSLNLLLLVKTSLIFAIKNPKLLILWCLTLEMYMAEILRKLRQLYYPDYLVNN